MQHVYPLAACLALWVTTASLHAQNISVYADFNLFELFETTADSYTKNGITIKNFSNVHDVNEKGLRIFSSTNGTEDSNIYFFSTFGIANASNYRIIGYTIAPYPADPNLDGDESFKIGDFHTGKSYTTAFTAGYHAFTDVDFPLLSGVLFKSTNSNIGASEVRLESFRIGIIPEPRSSALLLGTFSALAIWGYRRRSKILPRCR
jgi:hypothetical protein